MSLIKGKIECRTILDFSNDTVSKNKIQRALRSAEVIEMLCHDHNSYTFIENDIKVGMYNIKLAFYSLNTEGRSKLKEYGGFSIMVYENSKVKPKSINLSKDTRFKHQYWVPLASNYKVRMKHLTDAIHYTQRLNQLSAFL